LRVGELVGVRVDAIDGERKLLRIEQGKGAKDRLVLIAPVLLERLRGYWCDFRPESWLFFNPRHPDEALSISAAQRAYGKAKRLAGVEREGGIHALRHAYATHQLESGLPVHQLQKLLGHRNLASTLRYVHWVPDAQRGTRGHADLIGELEVGDE
ncbi:MAG: tyrosine-type recombinase/integrase, partial [Candidatus Sedimenticola endophacoides]